MGEITLTAGSSRPRTSHVEAAHAEDSIHPVVQVEDRVIEATAPNICRGDTRKFRSNEMLGVTIEVLALGLPVALLVGLGCLPIVFETVFNNAHAFAFLVVFLYGPVCLLVLAVVEHLSGYKLLRRIYEFLNQPGKRHLKSFFRTNEVTYSCLADPKSMIRSLSILPGRPEDTIQCLLVHTDMAGSRYEALSYSWQVPAYRSNLRVWLHGLFAMLFQGINACYANDLSEIPRDVKVFISGQPFYISATLARCLRSLRRTDEARTIWVDQLCINQVDAEEKANQVSRMAEIFANADKVIVWLDLKGKSRSWGASDASTFPNALKNCIANQPRSSDITRPLSQSHMQILRAIIRCSWWSRIWIIQEVALARKIQV